VIYVEWLRARKRLAIFAGVLALLVLLGILLVEFGYTHSDVAAHGRHQNFYLSIGSERSSGDVSARVAVHEELQRSRLPLDPFLLAASGIAFIFTIGLYTSLHAQRESLHLAWTKPLSRARLALAFFTVDLASIAALYAFVVILALLAAAVFGGLNRIVAPNAAAIVPLAGVLLLYGLMQMATAWLRGACGGMVAALWIAFFVVPSLILTPIPQLNSIARGVLPLIPMQYFSMHESNGVYTWGPHVAADVQTWGLPNTYGSMLLLGFSLGIAACALATVNWNRVEV
jgi:hypothetical protein